MNLASAKERLDDLANVLICNTIIIKNVDLGNGPQSVMLDKQQSKYFAIDNETKALTEV